MPDSGYYEKKPRPESIATFYRYLGAKANVGEVTRLGPQLALVKRKETPQELTVFMTNIYIIGEADLAEILTTNPEANVIVTMSAWNSYSPEAKAAATKSGVGLFTFKEFMKAVHLNGDEFLAHKERTERR